MRSYHIVAEKIQSCGCLHSETIKCVNLHHGLTNTPEFHIWVDMRKRCTNPKSTSYANYGGRGITVCDRWQTFEQFLADMGQRPTPLHMIERLNNNGNYEPDNCKWATRDEQAYNKRNNITFEYQGRIWTTKDVSLVTGLKLAAVRKRVRLGWTPERILTEPKRDW
jgi:hypothetical protein